MEDVSLRLTGSMFHRDGADTENALVPTSVLDDCGVNLRWSLCLVLRADFWIVIKSDRCDGSS